MKSFNKVTLALFLLGLSVGQVAVAETQNFRVYAVEIDKVKFWLPSTLFVKKGDTVKIKATSKIGGENNIHGFAIPAFKVESLVTDKETDIEFVAAKEGIFPIKCQLHPPHVGGQLVVLP